MTDVTSPAVELRLLTHRPEEMATWWAALVGSTPRSLNARMTAVTGAGLGVVIERSQIALDYHPEASGVTAISLTPGDLHVLGLMVNRLAQIGSRPYRATTQAGMTALWFRDPNGTDVALCLPTDPPTPAGRDRAAAGGLADEMNPDDVLAYIDGRQPATGDHGEVAQ